MAFQAGPRAERPSADYVHAHRCVLLVLSFTDVLPSHAPKSMPSERIKAGQKFEAVLQRFEVPMLRKEDFNNDKVDAGEIGAGHTVTALCEVVPVGTANNPATSVPSVDLLNYSSNEKSTSTRSTSSNEMLTVKLRYKKPDEDKSELVEHAVTDTNGRFENAPIDLKFAAAVAEVGMILRDSEYKGNGTFGTVLEWAREGKGSDANGYRAGFIELVRKAQALKES